MITCEEFTDRITDYLDGRVPFGKKMGLWLHQMMCVRCRTYLHQMRQVVDLMGELPAREAPAPPAPLRDDLMARFRQRHEDRCGCDDHDES